MRYEKPELVVLGSAIDVIQSSGHKSGFAQDSDCGGSDERPTNCAYEADE
jgi:hypothetical protein